MFCNKCGAENKDGAAFCSKCGAQLRMTQVNNTSSGSSDFHAGSSPKEREPGYFYGLISFIGSLVWMFFMMPFSSEGKTSSVFVLFLLGYVASIVFGIFGLKKGCKKWMAITGIIVSSLWILLLLWAYGQKDF